MGKLPKSPKKGQTASITSRGRKITFKATGRKWPKWKIVSNTKA